MAQSSEPTAIAESAFRCVLGTGTDIHPSTLGRTMEARCLLLKDGSAYAALRVQEVEEQPTQATTEQRDELAALKYDPATVIGRYLANGTVIWGAYDGQTLVGALAISRRFSVRVLTYLWVWGLYVRPHYRGTPASRALMTAALGWCEQQSPAQRVFGAYDTLNLRAIHFCQRYGFLAPEEGPAVLGDEACPPSYVLVECVWTIRLAPAT